MMRDLQTLDLGFPDELIIDNFAGEYATRMCEKWLHDQEGWPGPNGTPHGACGIALISADVDITFELNFEVVA